MEKLISMVEFVLETRKSNRGTIESEHLMVNYAKFLSKPLKLGFFVPCDADGNVLKVPKREHFLTESMLCRTDDLTKAMKEYQVAKERVLFEGFEFSHDNDYNSVVKQKTNSGIKVEIQFRKYEKDVRIIINSDYIHDCGCMERLIGLATKPVLTESAKKQIGL